MDNKDRNEFDIDFDFDKEYGYDTDGLLDPEYGEEDLLREFLAEDLPQAADAPVEEPVEYQPENYTEFQPEEHGAYRPEDFTEFIPDSSPEVQEPQPQNSLASEPTEDVFELNFPDVPPVNLQDPVAAYPASQEPVPAPEPPVAPISRAELRRRQKMKRRKFKEVYLPAILAGISVVMMLICIIGSISRAVSNGKAEDEAAKNASQAAEDAANALDREAAALLEQAKALAAGYNFQGAIDLLDSFSGELTSYPELLSAKASYSQELTNVKAWNNPSDITNLSFQVLIADPSRAFTDKSYGNAFNKNFVTTDEFQKILEQLYANGYVLVDLDSMITETTAADGSVTYSANTIYLPSDKTPIMITETMVNYQLYMVDGDDDGTPDAQGSGFANRLVVDADGKIKAEMVTSTGETVVGDYDLVPILETFIESHPDFVYQDARATLAVCGQDGVFGYRTNTGDADEIAGATQLVQALRDQGYTIACYTYDNLDYAATTVAGIQSDLESWFAKVQPILGQVDVLVFAKNVDISDYTGTKFSVLYSAGFRYFMGASTSPWAEIASDGSYFHQKRLMVTGTQMAYNSSVFSKYFNSMAILNDQRGSVPT